MGDSNHPGTTSEGGCADAGTHIPRSPKERPILMSAPMVRACLRSENSKTQTRRLFKVFPGDKTGITSPDEEVLRFEDGSFHYLSTGGLSGPYPCPYGAPGDRLWVREAFSGPHYCHGEPPRDWGHDSEIWYWADGNPDEGDWTKPKPGIHMPRWASRLTLEVTEVCIERLQDISEADALAEGVQKFPDGFHWEPNRGWPGEPPGTESMRFVGPTAQQAYFGLWEQINGRESLDANPWVWAISFARVK